MFRPRNFVLILAFLLGACGGDPEPLPTSPPRPGEPAGRRLTVKNLAQEFQHRYDTSRSAYIQPQPIEERDEGEFHTYTVKLTMTAATQRSDAPARTLSTFCSGKGGEDVGDACRAIDGGLIYFYRYTAGPTATLLLAEPRPGTSAVMTTDPGVVAPWNPPPAGVDQAMANIRTLLSDVQPLVGPECFERLARGVYRYADSATRLAQPKRQLLYSRPGGNMACTLGIVIEPARHGSQGIGCIAAELLAYRTRDVAGYFQPGAIVMSRQLSGCRRDGAPGGWDLSLQ
jgi:hypothetical protein